MRKPIIACVVATALFSAGVAADTLKASLAKMPVYAESKDKGILVDPVKAIDGNLADSVDYQVVPFKRSMDSVIKGQVQFHLPLIQNPQDNEADLPYDHSTETIFHVNFVLYSNKSKPIDMSNLSNYRIETDAAHVQYFPFKITASANLEGSIRKVDAGRIDGFIFADDAIDPLIKKLGLKNVKRDLYKTFDVKIILPKSAKGGPIDGKLSQAIGALRDSGKYNQIMGMIDHPYGNWQP